MLLAMGDTHIPDRAEEIPRELLEFIAREKPDAILFTGDATEYSVLFLLEELAPVHAVRGNMDNVDAPREKTLEFRGKQLLLTHGKRFGRGNYNAMVEYARSNGYDIVVCGHTHAQKTLRRGGVLVVNPGSATGASGRIASGEKTFTTIVINGGVEVAEHVVRDDGIQRKGAEGEN